MQKLNKTFAIIKMILLNYRWISKSLTFFKMFMINTGLSPSLVPIFLEFPLIYAAEFARRLI